MVPLVLFLPSHTTLPFLVSRAVYAVLLLDAQSVETAPIHHSVRISCLAPLFDAVVTHAFAKSRDFDLVVVSYIL